VEVYPPTAVTLNVPADTLCLNAGPYTLSGGTPADGEYSGPGVTDGVFDPEAAGLGTHTITLTYLDEFGCTYSATDQIVVDACAGIFDVEKPSHLAVSPNPTKGRVRIGQQSWQEWEVEVYDHLGRLLFRQAKAWTVDLSGQPAGTYFLVVRAEAQTGVARVVKE
jgi:hypothetical protein